MNDSIGARCAKCAFFQPQPVPALKTAGECRRDTPKLFVFPAQDMAGKMHLQPYTFWPGVDGVTQWCGEYRDKAANN